MVNAEGVCARYNIKQQDGEKVGRFEWHSFISDNKRQDARTCYANTDRLISKLRGYDCQLLKQKEDGEIAWIFEQSDGCAKQY